MRQSSRLIVLFLFVLSVPDLLSANAPKTRLNVILDTDEVPHLKKWGEQAQSILIEWHPRINNLLPTKGFKTPQKVQLKINKSDQGVGGTVGSSIGLSSSWIEKHPDDFGLVIHELVHVIQSYPSGDPIWLTEGIADYIRWGIYEGKDQNWFPRPKEKKGYKKGYQVTAGFLLWLESDIAPGIVKKLNTAMRNRKYSENLFHAETNQSLDNLWEAYISQK